MDEQQQHDQHEKIMAIVTPSVEPRRWWKPTLVNGKVLISAVFTVIVVAFALLAFALYINVDEARHDRQQLCISQNETRKILRDILVLAQAQSVHPEARFWTESLLLVKPLDCTDVSNLAEPGRRTNAAD